MDCIICGRAITPETSSDEHVFPEEIGGKFKIDAVCQPCNSSMGRSVDLGLTSHPIIQFVTYNKGIKNDGKLPKPLTRPVLPDGRYVHIVYDKTNVPQDVKLVRGRFPEKGTTEEGTVTFSSDARDEENHLAAIQSLLRRQGQPEKSREEIKQMSVLSTSSGPVSQTWSEDERLSLTSKMIPSMLKIAYELAWYWLGDTYLTDATAVQFRDCLQSHIAGNGSAKDVCDDFGVGVLGQDDPLIHDWIKETDSHLGLLVSHDNNLLLAIRIFNLFGFVVVISDDASRYQPFAPKFIANNSVTGEVRRTTLAHEMMRLGGQQ